MVLCGYLSPQTHDFTKLIAQTIKLEQITLTYELNSFECRFDEHL